jgi:CheY-like chemotaxis protein
LDFADISMPVMNGFEATRAIRRFEAEKQLKPAVIIALTGLANDRDEAEGLLAGCDIYMTKPASFKELAKLLKNCEGPTDVIGNP